jgi:glucose-6-phosphate 1-dehydrogenase
MSGDGPILVLIGATGDLAQRMLFPSLYHVTRDGLTPRGLRIVAAGRSELSDAKFREETGAALERFVKSDVYDAAATKAFLSGLSYQKLDAASPDGHRALAERFGFGPEDDVIYYLSTAPKLYAPVADALGAAGLVGPKTRIALEKPIGENLAASRLVNDALAKAFAERQIFRIDHYLGKETVQNLLALRFGNALFEPLWNAHYIEQVQISVAETVGFEGRADYYDGMGALRDMVQNHMLQLLALVAMEPPASLDPDALRNEKIKALRSLRAFGPSEVAAKTVRGQYEAGMIDGKAVASYAADGGKNPDTDTFCAIRAEIDNWRWAGTPFYLRTGKRMPSRTTEIFIQFRQPPHNIFAARGAAPLAANSLHIRLQPQETISLAVMAKEPGLDREGMRLRQVPLDISLTAAFPNIRRRIAYERLLLDLISGDPTLFVRRDEVEAAWAWIDGIADGWKAANMAPKPYAAGVWGPNAAIALPERFGHSWHE